MGLPAKRDPELFQEALRLIQPTRPQPLRIFEAEVGEVQTFREVRDVTVLDLFWEPDRERWRQLHNDPNVEIISEKEMSVKISIRTIIKFIRRIPIAPDPVDALWDDDE